VKLIVGLGNPGRRYERTRHNVGWTVLDHLADVWRFEGWRKDFEAIVADGRVGTERVRLLKPQTYMNLSGQALRPYLGRTEFDPSKDLLVIVDEVALPLGRMRLRASGSPGGHNGLRSIEAALGSQDYARLRVGIRPLDERRLEGGLSDFVLDDFGRDERETVHALLEKLTTATDEWIAGRIDAAMRIANRREKDAGDDAGGSAEGVE
jgi:PTH1 family peptidyl-tRNA hydrolase